jgi:glucokinase
VTTIGVDLGGTKILVGVVDHGRVVATHKASTPTTGPADVAAAIAELIARFDGTPHHIGVGTPGQVDDEGVVVGAPNLVGWEEPVPLRQLLRSATGVKDIAVDNDVNVATLAEHAAGVAKGKRDVLGVFMGTGVGGAVVLNGKLRRGARGLAGEIGHTVFRPGGRRCGCGLDGHVEAYAGRVGMENEARRRHDAGEPTALVRIAGDGRMKSGVFAEALAEGDPVAEELIDEAVEAVGVAIANAVVLLDVDFVVLGGGVAEKLGAELVTRVQEAARARIFGDTAVRVAAAALGDHAGVVGAAHLV